MLDHTGIAHEIMEQSLATARQEMEAFARQASGHHYGDVQVLTYVLHGDLVDEVMEMCKTIPIDLVIMETTGARGWQGLFGSSHTQHLIERSSIPVIVLPSGYAFHPMEKILLALDSGEMEPGASLGFLVTFVKKFNARLLIYHLEKPGEDDGIDPAVENLVQDVEHSYHYDLTTTDDVARAIDEFATDYGVDMICLLRRRRNFLSGLFHKSVTAQEIARPQMPVLILPKGEK